MGRHGDRLAGWSGNEKGVLFKETDKTITLKSLPGGNYYLPVKDIQTINGNSFDPKVDYLNMPSETTNPVNNIDAPGILANPSANAVAPIANDQPQQVIQNSPPIVDNSSSVSRQTYSNDKYKISFLVPTGFNVADGDAMAGLPVVKQVQYPICIMGPPSAAEVLVGMEYATQDLSE